MLSLKQLEILIFVSLVSLFFAIASKLLEVEIKMETSGLIKLIGIGVFVTASVLSYLFGKTNKFPKANLINISIGLISFGIIFIIIFSLQFFFNSSELKFGLIDTNIWGHFGDIVGGFVGTIVALVGVLLLFETLKQQRETYIRQQVETRFFELLKLHRDNVTEIHSKGKDGRSVFIEIKDEFHELYELITQHFALANLKEGDWNKRLVQITYLIVYFGVDNSSTDYLKRRVEEIISNRLLYNDFEKFCLNSLIKTHRISEAQNDRKVARNKKRFLEYDGHQSRLSHYFRHLFQTVKYINEQKRELFSYKEKYAYIEILRAQLSTHEQALLLYNSISPLGEPWELSSKIADDVNKKLITKYNLIKNIPFRFTKNIDPKDYFPHISYEFDDELSDERKEIEKAYW